MFSTFKQKLILGIYIFIILSIPIGAYLASQSQTTKSRASETNTTIVKNTPRPTTPLAKQLLGASGANLQSNSPAGEPSPTPQPSTATIATSFGPTLSLKVKLEGRPENNQTTKLFVGIFEGAITANPKFILSFTLDLPADGTYTNLSLAGLTTGTQYTALLKGSAQIATSASFTMSPTISNLNDGQALDLTTGDLNEDNVINAADLSIAQKALGSTPKSSNWNSNADFNADGIINSFDLAIISRNMDKVGVSGAWTSPIPKVSTPSASLNNPTPQGGISEETKGYWIWLPK